MNNENTFPNPQGYVEAEFGTTEALRSRTTSPVISSYNSSYASRDTTPGLHASPHTRISSPQPKPSAPPQELRQVTSYHVQFASVLGGIVVLGGTSLALAMVISNGGDPAQLGVGFFSGTVLTWYFL
jgi:hypothetical protein